ncbi:MAG: FCD domain-containing protein [Streptosporangiales bacterium]|nr:FCD domain-containing protein [Streptosporangiales bacterium]
MTDWSKLTRDTTTLCQHLATELELMIMRGELPRGERIPPERELAATLGVSRTSLRQALHELQLKGLLDRRPGRGTIVVERLPSGLGAALSSALGAAEHDFRQVMDLRATVEPQVAARAAERATRPDLRRLRELLAEAESEPAASRLLDLEFHRAVGDAAHNPLVGELMNVVCEWGRSSRRLGLQGKRRRNLSLTAHREILDAIQAGTPDAAEAAMAEHLRSIGELVGAELADSGKSPGRRTA